MAGIELVHADELLSMPLHSFLRNGAGLIVDCGTAESGRNVVTFLRGMCFQDHDGLKTRDGVPVTIYEELSDASECDFIFMLPRDMSIESAIHMYKTQFE